MKTSFYIFVVFFMFFVKVSGMEPAAQPESLRAGMAAYTRGDYSVSMDLFMQAIIREPENRQAKRYMKFSAEKLLEQKKSKAREEKEEILKNISAKLKKMEEDYRLKETYESAVSAYEDKQYVRAAFLFSDVSARMPGYKNSPDYLAEINGIMRNMGNIDSSLEEAMIPYARGYSGFFRGEYSTAINEWEKFLAEDPEHKEITEFLELSRMRIKEQQAKRELEEAGKKEEARLSGIIAEAEKLLARGKEEFSSGLYTLSRRSFEKAADLVKNETDERFENLREKAIDGVDRTFSEIEKVIARAEKIEGDRQAALAAGAAAARVKSETVADKKIAVKELKPEAPEPEPAADTEKSNEHYTAGLVAYAQGRMKNAIKEWEISLKYDPGNIRSRTAKEMAETELLLGKKKDE